MEGRLALLRSLAQKDKAQAYSTLLTDVLSNAANDPAAVGRDVHTLVETVLTQDHVGIVVGRQILSELVKYLADGAIKDAEVKKAIVKDTLLIAQPRLVSYEEQVSTKSSRTTGSYSDPPLKINALRFQLADLLEHEEEWSEAARVLMGISMDSGHRFVPQSHHQSDIAHLIKLHVLEPSQTKKSSRSTFVSFVFFSKTKTPFRRKHTTIAPRCLSTRRMTAKHC